MYNTLSMGRSQQIVHSVPLPPVAAVASAHCCIVAVESSVEYDVADTGCEARAVIHETTDRIILAVNTPTVLCTMSGMDISHYAMIHII